MTTFNQTFVERYAEEYEVDPSPTNRSFALSYRKCARGEADLLRKLGHYTELWGWERSVRDLATYWFETQGQGDDRIVRLVRRARAEGHECFLASDQDYVRSAYLISRPSMRDAFDRFFFSHEPGVTKRDPAFFERVLGLLDATPGDTHSWDDNPTNVEVVALSGIVADHYADFPDFARGFMARFLTGEPPVA